MTCLPLQHLNLRKDAREYKSIISTWQFAVLEWPWSAIHRGLLFKELVVKEIEAFDKLFGNDVGGI